MLGVGCEGIVEGLKDEGEQRGGGSCVGVGGLVAEQGAEAIEDGTEAALFVHEASKLAEQDEAVIEGAGSIEQDG